MGGALFGGVSQRETCSLAVKPLPEKETGAPTPAGYVPAGNTPDVVDEVADDAVVLAVAPTA